MTTLGQLDPGEITAWLTRVAQTIDRNLREPARAAATALLAAGLGETRAGLPVLAQLALLDDCLRAAHLAIRADAPLADLRRPRVAALVAVAASKYFAALPAYESFADGAASPEEANRFLAAHETDAGPFGFASPSPWRGLALARMIDEQTRNAAPLRDLERMLARVMDAVFAGSTTEVDRAARRRLHSWFEPAVAEGLDPRATAFCRPDGPEVFASVAHGSHVHERDPFDVESIHAEARDVFRRQVERATTPEEHQRGTGRTLLVLGESGAGKTHLLRALRTQVHGQRLGYVGYLQMTTEVGDYARYVLRSLVDSLERPYDAPGLAESGLTYLSNGLTDGRAAIPAAELEQLRTAELTGPELDAIVGRVVDRIVRTEGLAHLEVDLLHALLLLQRRDPALTRRVIRFLRCEALTAHDRTLLGGLAARDQPEDPLRTLRQLAAIMYELHMAALVIVVDQIEETIPDGQTITRLQQAFDSLRAIADATPSAVVVISCLQDVYDAVRPRLSRSLVDRLEHEPPPVRLTSQRQVEDVELMLARRLEHLYATFDVPWREDDPLYPFTAAQVQAASKLRARDVLHRFRAYHAACIAAGALVAADATASSGRPRPASIPPASLAPIPAPPVTPSRPGAAAPPPTPPPSPPMVAPPAPPPPDLERAWQAARAAAPMPPEDDDAVLDLVAEAARGAAVESGLPVTVARTSQRLELVLGGVGTGRRVVALCNRGAQGGHLGRQLAQLQAQIAPGVSVVALRNADFTFQPKSQISAQVGEFARVGGRRAVLAETDLRSVLALRQLTASSGAAVPAWQRVARPLSQLGFVRTLLDLDELPSAAPPPAAPPPTLPPPVPPPRPPTVPSRGAGTEQTTTEPDPTTVRLGVTTSLRAEPERLTLAQLTTHAAFLGSTGSGKTTAALHVIEQLLERGVSAILVDRKGDLARYASDAWWRDPQAPDAARRRALRDRIDVALYTPGASAGRPLRIPLVPAAPGCTRQEAQQTADYAAKGLAAMLGYGTSSTHKHRQSVLQVAIELHAGEREVTLDVLRDTLDRPDPELLQRVDNLQRHFGPLAEDLQSLGIQRGPLLVGDGEALDAGTLLPPRGGRPRLTILHLGALSEVAVLQFWVSRFLVELGRLARRRPSPTLQGVVFLDEADAYIPAVATPVTKEPLFDLLRRGRSGGLGVLLATQNPGDLDYKARDNIGTWIVGKVAQERAVEKMRYLIGDYPNVGPRLASQATGHFFVLTAGRSVEVRMDRALMTTAQVPDDEVQALARATTPT